MNTTKRDYTICATCHKALCACGDPPTAGFEVSEFGIAVPYKLLEDDHYSVYQEIANQLMQLHRDRLDLMMRHVGGVCPFGDIGCAYCKPEPIEQAEDDNECCCACHDEDDD